MLPSLRAPAATVFLRAGAGCGPTAARRLVRPRSRRRASRPTTMPMTRIRTRRILSGNERYGYQGSQRKDAAPLDAEAVAEAAGRTEHGPAELLARPLEGGRRRDGEASRGPRRGAEGRSSRGQR